MIQHEALKGKSRIPGSTVIFEIKYDKIKIIINSIQYPYGDFCLIGKVIKLKVGYFLKYRI